MQRHSIIALDSVVPLRMRSIYFSLTFSATREVPGRRAEELVELTTHGDFDGASGNVRRFEPSRRPILTCKRLISFPMDTGGVSSMSFLETQSTYPTVSSSQILLPLLDRGITEMMMPS